MTRRAIGALRLAAAAAAGTALMLPQAQAAICSLKTTGQTFNCPPGIPGGSVAQFFDTISVTFKLPGGGFQDFNGNAFSFGGFGGGGGGTTGGGGASSGAEQAGLTQNPPGGPPGTGGGSGPGEPPPPSGPPERATFEDWSVDSLFLIGILYLGGEKDLLIRTRDVRDKDVEQTPGGVGGLFGSNPEATLPDSGGSAGGPPAGGGGDPYQDLGNTVSDIENALDGQLGGTGGPGGGPNPIGGPPPPPPPPSTGPVAQAATVDGGDDATAQRFVNRARQQIAKWQKTVNDPNASPQDKNTAKASLAAAAQFGAINQTEVGAAGSPPLTSTR